MRTSHEPALISEKRGAQKPGTLRSVGGSRTVSNSAMLS